MKKLHIIIWLLALIFLSCDNKKDHIVKNDLYLANLKGKIKSVLLEDFFLGDSTQLRYSLFTKYDSLGNRIYYKFGGAIVGESIINNQYDKDEKLMKKEEVSLSDQSLNTTSIYSYENNLLKEITDMDVTSKIIAKYFFDDSENEVKSEKYRNGGVYQTTLKTYNNVGNLILKERLDSNKTLKKRYTYKYTNNALIESTELSTKNNNSIKIEYKESNYDENKNWLERIEIENGDTRIVKRKIEYFQ